MMRGVSLEIALEALLRNRLRAGLAVLGMAIGVGTVVTTFALGTGARGSISSTLESAGTTRILVRAGNFTRGGDAYGIATGLGSAGTLVAADLQSIRALDGVASASAVMRDRGWVMNAGDPARREFTQILGVDHDYPKHYDWRMEKGKFFTAEDVHAAAAVTVLGSALRARIFGNAVAVGQTVNIRDASFRVIGVVTSQAPDENELAFVPYTTLQRSKGTAALDVIVVSARQAGITTTLGGQIKALLRERHRLGAGPDGRRAGLGLGGNQFPGQGVPDDFTVTTQAAEALNMGLHTAVAAFVLANMSRLEQVNMQEMSATLSRAGSTMTALLAAISAISLVVGGIGVMNVMTISVTERTREIGLRRAIGACRSDVRRQFLFEALALSLAGGVLGILTGVVASFAVVHVLDWPAVVSFGAAALALVVAGSCGLLFGLYPAQRASNVSPIDALRYE